MESARFLSQLNHKALLFSRTCLIIELSWLISYKCFSKSVVRLGMQFYPTNVPGVHVFAVIVISIEVISIKKMYSDLRPELVFQEILEMIFR